MHRTGSEAKSSSFEIRSKKPKEEEEVQDDDGGDQDELRNFGINSWKCGKWRSKILRCGIT